MQENGSIYAPQALLLNQAFPATRLLEGASLPLPGRDNIHMLFGLFRSCRWSSSLQHKNLRTAKKTKEFRLSKMDIISLFLTPLTLPTYINYDNSRYTSRLGLGECSAHGAPLPELGIYLGRPIHWERTRTPYIAAHDL